MQGVITCLDYPKPYHISYSLLVEIKAAMRSGVGRYRCFLDRLADTSAFHGQGGRAPHFLLPNLISAPVTPEAARRTRTSHASGWRVRSLLLYSGESFSHGAAAARPAQSSTTAARAAAAKTSGEERAAPMRASPVAS